MLFVVDFDGTISQGDTIDALLETFADDRWQAYERAWLAGEIDAVTCMQQQLALVKADNIAIESFFRSIQLDHSFLRFYALAKQVGKVVIASDGLDHAIKVAMQHARFPNIPMFANRLHFTPQGIRMSFPNRQADCAGGNGNCKCAVARSQQTAASEPIVLIGDGKSDACLAQRADVVFAKAGLLRFCIDRQIPHIPFHTFDDIVAVLQDWSACRDAFLPSTAPLRTHEYGY